MFYFLFFYTLDSQKAEVFWDREIQLRQGSSVGLAHVMIHHNRAAFCIVAWAYCGGNKICSEQVFSKAVLNVHNLSLAGYCEQDR